MTTMTKTPALERRPDRMHVSPVVEGSLDTSEQDAAIGAAINAAIKSCLKSGLTQAQIEGVCDIAHAYFRPTLNVLRARITQLEARPELKHVGPWAESQHYAAGCIVQYKGGAWLAKTQTSAKPGGSEDASRAWVLVARGGRDAPDNSDLRRRLDAIERRLERTGS